MNDTKQISGELMVPCFMTTEEFENGYKKSIFWTESNYYDEYQKHIIAMEHIASCAKIYIFKNYGNISDWSRLNLTVIHGPTGKSTRFYNYIPDTLFLPKEFERLQRDMEKREMKKHNPIESITDVILDPTDGDFSLSINGKEYWWIQDEAIILIADYIEKEIKSINNK